MEGVSGVCPSDPPRYFIYNKLLGNSSAAREWWASGGFGIPNGWTVIPSE